MKNGLSTMGALPLNSFLNLYEAIKYRMCLHRNVNHEILRIGSGSIFAKVTGPSQLELYTDVWDAYAMISKLGKVTWKDVDDAITMVELTK